MHTDPREEWPLPLAGPSAAAVSSRGEFVAGVRSNLAALIVADRGLDAPAIARAIHERSRPGTPFIVIDCAAGGGQGAQDVDRQLFGTRPRGEARADLDAVGTSSALLRARGGTLYLKHILDLPAATQRRLARILRDREVSATGRRVPVRGRIIGDAPPSVAVQGGEGHFRSELFRRLAGTCLPVPPLSERPE